jgi:plastocyanin
MRWLPPTSLACLAALAGCGGADDAPTRTVKVEAGEPIAVSAKEYAFDPTTIVVGSGRRPLRIALDNEGDLAHNIRVFDGDTELGGLPSFPGGERRTTALRLEPGSYRLVCTVADHEDLGMRGELEVRR